jgi:hypothetical protein
MHSAMRLLAENLASDFHGKTKGEQPTRSPPVSPFHDHLITRSHDHQTT